VRDRAGPVMKEVDGLSRKKIKWADLFFFEFCFYYLLSLLRGEKFLWGIFLTTLILVTKVGMLQTYPTWIESHPRDLKCSSNKWGKFFLKCVFSFPCRFSLRMPAPMNLAKFKGLCPGPSGHSVQDSHEYLLILQIIL
jgi:hypothetical protein